jgi:hypothetical protein
VVDAGDTLTLIVPEGSGGRVVGQISTLAWALSGIAMGVEVYGQVAGALKANRVAEASAGTFERLMDVVSGASLDGYEAAFRSCAEALSDATEHNDSADKWFATLWVGCIPGLMRADIAATGVRMFALGAVLTVVATAVSAVYTAAALINSGLRELWDTIFTPKEAGANVYRIRVTAAELEAPLVLTEQGLGSLRVGATIEEAEATGLVEWNPAACPAEVYGQDIGRLEASSPYARLMGMNPVGLDAFPAFAVDVDFDTKRVRWIDVYDASIATAEGVRVGDTANVLDEVYGDELRFGDSSYPDQESYVLWLRRGDVDLVFDILSGPEGEVDPPSALIWAMGVIEAQETHYTRYRTDDVPGAC